MAKINSGVTREEEHISKLAERVDWDTWWPLRRHTRHPVDFPVSIKETIQGAVRSFSGQCRDFSDSGIGTEIAAELQAGEIVSLELGLPSSVPVVLAARVRHRTGSRVGFEFLAVSGVIMQQIKSACNVPAL